MTEPRFLRSRAAPAAALACVLLGACTMIPRYERPAAPVAAAFPAVGAASPDAGQKPADATDWRSYFTDPRLQRLIQTALDNNRDLRVAVLNIEQARAQYDIRRADLLPTVGVGFSSSSQPSTVQRNTQARLYQVGFSVTSYELDLFGRVRSLSQSALEQYLATEEARKAAQISLVSSVAIGYLNLVADDELLAVVRQTLSSREESLKLTKLKFDNGAASELDYRQAQSLLETARIALYAQARQRALDENALVLLLGQPLPADLPSVKPLLQQALPDLPAGVPSEVLTRRPDVRQAEQQLLSANANIGAARAAFFPRITLTGSAGTASTQLDGLFKGGSFAWTFSGQALETIFDAGRNQANLAVAKVSRDIAVAQYEKAIQSAFREVADALAGRATLGDQVRSQQAQAEALQQSFKLADLRYRNGAASYLDLLDAQRSLFTAQQAVVQTQVQQVQNLVTLYKVLGGGWTEPATASR
jgi:multidrug efflux system outer membrane protein